MRGGRSPPPTRMDINGFLLTLGLPGFFSTRAFTPAFLTALVMRYGDSLPYLKGIEFLQMTGKEPMWFTSNWCILGLGVLAALELFATKSPEAEAMLADVHKYAKTGMSFLTTMGVVGAGDMNYLGDLFRTQEAGLVLNAWATLIAGMTFVLTTLRNAAFSVLTEADPDDDLGLRKLLSWFEDTWGALGLLFVFFYPIILLILVGVFTGGLVAVRKYAEYRDEKSKVPCPGCEAPMYSSAPHCPSCGAVNPEPKAVGLFGQAKLAVAAPPPAQHALRLATKKRCPHCATRLPKRDPNAACSACGSVPFGTQGFRDDYASLVNGRLFKVLGISFLFGLIPVFGMIPGMIYYRIALIAPYRGYISGGKAFLLRWLLRLIFLVLISVQGIPAVLAVVAPPSAPLALLVGGFTVPVMALLSYGVFRLAFWRQLSPLGNAVAS